MMNVYRCLVLIAFSMPSLSCIAQESNERINIAPPTIAQEATSIWRTINDISFFEEQGYTINLPQHSIIDSLIIKSKKGAFGNDDFSTIHTLLETTFFSSGDYTKATQKVKNQTELISSLVNEIDATKKEWDWDFKTFKEYKIFLTLYGTGGSYDPDEGTITLLTNEKGDFMNYQNPANTIIHEITHIGMENSIVLKYDLTHGLKERVVDTFVFLLFQETLPEYTIQNMGDKGIDKQLKKRKNITSLNAIIVKFIN